MKLRHVTTVALALLVLGACRKRPDVVPTPADDPTAGFDYDAARADSIRLAEQHRLDMERTERDRLMRETARAREILTEIVFFDYDSYEIGYEGEQTLQAKIPLLRANPGLRLRVEGHADQRGSTEYNLALGQRRAEAVRDYLAAYGVDASRVGTSSYGKERPLVDGEGEAAWSRNRRAEFAVTAGEITVVPDGYR
jgi:peptidoglycan-associated lipoprotein